MTFPRLVQILMLAWQIVLYVAVVSILISERDVSHNTWAGAVFFLGPAVIFVQSAFFEGRR